MYVVVRLYCPALQFYSYYQCNHKVLLHYLMSLCFIVNSFLLLFSVCAHILINSNIHRILLCRYLLVLCAGNQSAFSAQCNSVSCVTN